MSTDFYEGLKKRQSDAIPEAIVHFEQALQESNTVIAAAAAGELMSLHFAGTDIPAATVNRIRRAASGSWAAALDVINAGGGIVNREKALALLLNGEYRLPDEAARYILHQWRSDAPHTVSLTDAENAAIDGRFAISRFRYNEAMLFFRIAMRDSPDLFFRYPDLLGDLGRGFQYTATGTEGRDLFLEWEKNGFDAITTDNEHLVRFQLLFFAARIARQRGLANIELFEQALHYAPEVSAEQTDACIWYILDSSLAQGTDTVIGYLQKYSPAWNDDSYFLDVMDKLSRELVSKRQWEHVLTVFELLQKRSGVVTAKYAWVIGRAIEEGLLSPDEVRRAEGFVMSGARTTSEIIQAYKRIAYNAQNALYYRAVSAAALNEPFLAQPPEAKPPPEKNKSDTLRFILGFFENDSAEFASRYIRSMESSLSPQDLYFIAEALCHAGQYQETIRLVARYIRRDNYRAQRWDLELLYPRPFRELVEHYAQETANDTAILFGLIRTESAFNSTAVSRAGAVGLTQLMPATAEETATRIRRQGGPDYTIIDDPTERETVPSYAWLWDPSVNIHIGATYLAFLNNRMGDPLLALLAYNGGMNRVRRWRGETNAPSHIPLPPDLFLETIEFPETRNYGRSVIAAAAMYRELYYTP